MAEIDTAFIRESVNSGLKVRWRGDEILPFCDEVERLRSALSNARALSDKYQDLADNLAKTQIAARADALEEALRAATEAKRKWDDDAEPEEDILDALVVKLRALASGGGTTEATTDRPRASSP